MSLSQPSHTIVVEPVRVTMTTAPVPTEARPDEKPKPAEVAAKA
jgi:hypothetical protein